MKKVKTLAAAVTAALLLSIVPAAFGHGDGGRAKKAVDYSKAEEMVFGRAGNPAKAGRTIQVGMDDSMHFTPGDLVAKRGETIRFAVRNDGKVMHEMVIGTMKELKEHAELMKKFPAMEHDEPYMAHVAPGKRGELVWQFTLAGEFYYACLIPGHLEAGMIAKIVVK
jgi:uncharacterized cupredoxin-like copper-binding protein